MASPPVRTVLPRPYEWALGRTLWRGTPAQSDANDGLEDWASLERRRSVLDVRLCGGVEIHVDGRALPDALIGGRQGRLVLAYLVCERDRAVRREELADLL